VINAASQTCPPIDDQPWAAQLILGRDWYGKYRCRRVVPAIKVRIGSAKHGTVQNRACWEFEDMVVPDGGIGRTPETRGVDRITKNLEDSALLANQSNGIPLVSRDANVLRPVGG
jgi:hypothetical protein